MTGQDSSLENPWIHTAYTIERQLKLYAKSEEATERHQVLWHAWNQNKRWLTQMLEWTLPSFQTYSYHNASHADSVLHNIERVLGEERIKQLSATDCFMLLHAAYMHDIGMSISAEERQKMMEDDKFVDLIERLQSEGDPDMRKAAESVLRTSYSAYEGVSSRERSPKLKGMLHEKLDTYYGLGQLMAEYQREMHASKVKERMQQWTLAPEKLGNSLSVSGVPLRIFLRIADCAAIHTTSGIEPVLELPKEDSGYVLDMVHPRFVAVMLQLGDALDMDNDRFNPFCFKFAGSFPRTSTLHYKKHQSIRQLNITPERIEIHADCDSQEALRLVRMECEGLEEILKNASYHWADIAPAELSGCLPTMEQGKILFKGQRVPGELVKAQFNISQVRAFRLLEGANVYGGNYVFLREIIQNAIDASKMQCWEDYLYRCKLRERKILQDNFEETEYGINPSEKEVLSEVDVWDYPIEVYLELGIRSLGKGEEAEFTPLEEIEDIRKAEGEYGVKITIRDHGTGISKDDLIKISDVGSSYEGKRHFIDKMPDWLKPTGQFGIGLQSVFLITDSVTARTYTRSGEKFEITFNKVSNGSGGYINVKPLLQEDYVTFGTTFEIFLDSKYKLPHADFWEAWNTDSDDADRFADGYDEKRPIRHSQEMLNQIVMYIDNMLGENLFPIYVKIKGKGFDKKQYDFIAKQVDKVVLELDSEQTESIVEKEKKVSWLFKAIRPETERVEENNAKNQLIIVDIKDGIGALDCERAKLYIWNNVLGVFARFGGSRMLSIYSSVSKLWEAETQDKRKTRIYLKGIFVQSHSMYQDSELLELIDIKGGKIGKAHIAVNRNEFTKEGIDYLEQEIYPALIASARAALVELNDSENREQEKEREQEKRRAQEKITKRIPFYQKIMNSIYKKILACKTAEENLDALKRDLEETVLSAVGLSYFLRVLGKEKELFCEKKGTSQECNWDKLLNEIVKFRWEKKNVTVKWEGEEKEISGEDFDKYLNSGMMHKMSAFFLDEVKINGFFDGMREAVDYASLLQEKTKVAIVSMRHNEHTKWFYVPMIIWEKDYEIFQKKSRSWEEEEDALKTLEVWADGIIRKLGSIEDIQALHEEYGADSDIQYTLNFMLGNIPTIALYANRDGNVRINVLSAEQSGSVFLNRNMKRIILKKVNNLYMQSHAKRFVTTVWRSYECITLEEAPSSVCVANGAFIARQQTQKMLLPVLGENVHNLLKLREQVFIKEIMIQKEQCQQLEEYCNNLMGLYQSLEAVICQGRREDIADKELSVYLTEEKNLGDLEQIDFVNGKNYAKNYWREITLFVKDERSAFLKNNSQNSAESKPEKGEEYNLLWDKKPERSTFQRVLIRLFFEKRGNKPEQSEQLTREEIEETWNWFQNALEFISRYRNLDIQKLVTSHPKVEEFKKTLWGKSQKGDLDTVQKNLINYVMKHAVEKLSEKQIRNCYEKLLDDMLACVLETEPEEKKKYTIIEALF